MSEAEKFTGGRGASKRRRTGRRDNNSLNQHQNHDNLPDSPAMSAPSNDNSTSADYRMKNQQKRRSNYRYHKTPISAEVMAAVKENQYAYIVGIDFVKCRFMVQPNEITTALINEKIARQNRARTVTSTFVHFSEITNRAGQYDSSRVNECTIGDTLVVNNIDICIDDTVSLKRAVNLYKTLLSEIKQTAIGVLRPRLPCKETEEGSEEDNDVAIIEKHKGYVVLPYSKKYKAFYRSSQFKEADQANIRHGSFVRCTIVKVDPECPTTQDDDVREFPFAVIDIQLMSNEQVSALVDYTIFKQSYPDQGEHKFLHDFIESRCCVINNEKECDFHQMRKKMMKLEGQIISDPKQASVTISLEWPVKPNLDTEDPDVRNQRIDEFFMPQQEELLNVNIGRLSYVAVPITQINQGKTKTHRQVTVKLRPGQGLQLRNEGLIRRHHDNGNYGTLNCIIKPDLDDASRMNLTREALSLIDRLGSITEGQKRTIMRYIGVQKQDPFSDVREEFTVPENVPNFTSNQEQLKLCQAVMDGQHSVIPTSGPPGSGKSDQSVILLRSMLITAAERSETSKGPTYWIVSESNDATSNAARIAASIVKQWPHPKFRPLRVFARSKEHTSDEEVQPISLHFMINNLPEDDKYDECREINDEIHELENQISEADWSRFGKRSDQPPDLNDEKKEDQIDIQQAMELIKKLNIAKKKLETSFLKAYQPNLMFTTLASSLDVRLKPFRIDGLICDECAHCQEASLIPLLTKLAKDNPFVVLVGDRKQLGPVTKAKGQCKRIALMTALDRMERVMNMTPIKFRVWYRSHPDITSWCNEKFYNNMMKNGTKLEERMKAVKSMAFPNNSPVLFIDVQGEERKIGTTFTNPVEALTVKQVHSNVLKAGFAPKNIAIISMYSAQIGELLTKIANDETKITTVDSMLGQQADAVIVSTVRASEDTSRDCVGFLKDERRLNVSLTRAKFALFIVGSRKTLSTNSTWQEYINHLMKNDSVMTRLEYDQHVQEYESIQEHSLLAEDIEDRPQSATVPQNWPSLCSNKAVQL